MEELDNTPLGEPAEVIDTGKHGTDKWALPSGSLKKLSLRSENGNPKEAKAEAGNNTT